MLSSCFYHLPSSNVSWNSPISGIHVCCFSFSEPVELHTSSSSPVSAYPSLEILFCQNGLLLLEQKEKSPFVSEAGEILILTDHAGFSTVSCYAPCSGILLCMDSSLEKENNFFSSPLPTITEIADILNSSDCGIGFFSSSWTQLSFEVFAKLSQKEQATYCVYKALELLFLLRNQCSPPQKLLFCNGKKYINQTILEIRAYMLEHLSEPLTISTLSGKFFISPSTLKSGFQKMYGVSIHHWIQEQRIRKAALLLKSSKISVQQAALSVGYEGVGQFSTVFKRYYGITPGQYIKNVQNR
nr:helix-turn-helix domain-containing protein [uncultured Blautia sp.]